MKILQTFFILYSLVCVLGEVKPPPCRNGFIRLRNSCYHFSEVATNWTEAGERCQDMGARLVSIETSEEALDIHLRILYKFRAAGYWTSGTDLGTEGSFRWSSTGKNFGFTAWCHGQPDNYMGREHCAHIHHDNHFTCWNDLPCNATKRPQYPLYFICEY